VPYIGSSLKVTPSLHHMSHFLYNSTLIKHQFGFNINSSDFYQESSLFESQPGRQLFYLPLFFSVPPRIHQDNTSQQIVSLLYSFVRYSHSLATCCSTPHYLNYWHKNTGICLPQCTVSQFHKPIHRRQNFPSHQGTAQLALDPCNLHTETLITEFPIQGHEHGDCKVAYGT
jgi:hypothetical protein